MEYNSNVFAKEEPDTYVLREQRRRPGRRWTKVPVVFTLWSRVVKKGKIMLLFYTLLNSFFIWTCANLGASQVVLVVKNLVANAADIRDVGSVPGWRRSPGRGDGNPLQYSCLENPMDRGAWQAIGFRVTKRPTPLMLLSMHAHDNFIRASVKKSNLDWMR